MKKKNVKTHTFNGTTYDIDIDNNQAGYCEKPNSAKPSLAVFTDIHTRKGLEHLIHESLHACSYNTSEEWVDRSANDIARFLWRLGYRLKGG